MDKRKAIIAQRVKAKEYKANEWRGIMPPGKSKSKREPAKRTMDANDGEQAGPSGAGEEPTPKQSRVERSTGGGSSGATGGSGGGAVGRVISPYINEIFFQDDGFTVVKTNNIILPALENINPYQIMSCESWSGSDTVYQVTSDWRVLDWNNSEWMFDTDWKQHIINHYEEWTPDSWAVEMDGIRVFTHNNVGGTDQVSIDLTGAVCVALKKHGEFPFQNWGYTENNVGVFSYWQSPNPWVADTPPVMRYFTSNNESQDQMYPAYVVERGAVQHYTSSDTFRCGGKFGQATSMSNHVLDRSIMDYTNQIFQTPADMSENIKSAYWGLRPWDPAHTQIGDLAFMVIQQYNPGEQPEEGKTVKQYSTNPVNITSDQSGEPAWNNKYNREVGLESMRAQGHVSVDNPVSEVPQPFATTNWSEVRGNSQFPGNSAVYPLPIYVPKPWGATCHKPRMPASAVDDVPPSIMLKLKPNVTTPNGTLLNQTATAQVKYVVKYRAKKFKRSKSLAQAQAYWNPVNPYWDWTAQPNVQVVGWPNMTGRLGWQYGPKKCLY